MTKNKQLSYNGIGYRFQQGHIVLSFLVETFISCPDRISWINRNIKKGYHFESSLHSIDFRIHIILHILFLVILASCSLSHPGRSIFFMSHVLLLLYTCSQFLIPYFQSWQKNPSLSKAVFLFASVNFASLYVMTLENGIGQKLVKH